MCNCIKETEERYKKHLKENNPMFKDIDDFTVEFANVAYMFGSGEEELTIPIDIEWKHKAKSGRVINKKKTQGFTISYCPFCGEKKQKKGDNHND